jgi:hypothetical protein
MHALIIAIERNRSTKWILRLWSQFIKERDGYRCLCCESTEAIQAHHIIRRTLYPSAAFETGNGVTLCKACHKRVHEKSNGRAQLSQPLGEGDDQDEWAFLFGLLLDDAKQRGVSQDEFYFLADHIVHFSVKVQGYEYLREMVTRGEITRIKFAHEIWRSMPESFYLKIIPEIIGLNM